MNFVIIVIECLTIGNMKTRLLCNNLTDNKCFIRMYDKEEFSDVPVSCEVYDRNLRGRETKPARKRL